MANEQNLIPGAHTLTLEEQSKGGIASGKARKQRADLRKVAQEILDGTFTDRSGREFTGVEAITQSILANIANPNSKNWGKAMELLVQLVGANKSREEKQLIKAQAALIKARTELMDNSDKNVLDKLDAVLRQIGE